MIFQTENIRKLYFKNNFNWIRRYDPYWSRDIAAVKELIRTTAVLKALEKKVGGFN